MMKTHIRSNYDYLRPVSAEHALELVEDTVVLVKIAQFTLEMVVDLNRL